MNGLVPFDPFAELNALQKQFFGNDLLTLPKSSSMPTTDVYTNEGKELVVEAHLPHFEENDVDIHIDNGALVIQAEKHEKEEDKKKQYVVRESSSSFYRRIRLPQRADEERIAAHMENGVLKVTVPLTPLPEPKKIAIGGGKKNK